MVKTKERTYNIPLRSEVRKVAEWDRASKAVKAARKFLVKNMKNEDVKLGRHLNMELHSGGRKHPPHHVKVEVYEEEGVVHAELVGAPVEKQPEVKETKDHKVKSTEEAKKITKKEAAKEEEKKEVLEKPVDHAKEVKGTKLHKDKEAEIKQAMEVRTTKTEKPKHEKKK
ncbi:MAG: hypothetical protein Q8R00_02770 [Candidatus Nanoarchaeia archaeon]|nr:hypothetical protein [Candidatus Nanoarchaeia archaeon]